MLFSFMNYETDLAYVMAREPIDEGRASYYGQTERWRGLPTASGEAFDPDVFAAAHRTLPFGTKLLVENMANGKTVLVKVNDRGPFGMVDENGEWWAGRRYKDGLWRVRNRAYERKTLTEQPGPYRAVIDLTPAAARKISHRTDDVVPVMRVRLYKI
jgi:rare lipoprotein A (peptidoglycan hydrolase)